MKEIVVRGFEIKNIARGDVALQCTQGNIRLYDLQDSVANDLRLGRKYTMIIQEEK